jgi:hypothetical protein
MTDDAAVILQLALQPSPAAAAAVIASTPAAQCKRLALALGASARAARSRTRAEEWLAQQSAWARKYRALHDKFRVACIRSASARQPAHVSQRCRRCCTRRNLLARRQFNQVTASAASRALASSFCKSGIAGVLRPCQ